MRTANPLRVFLLVSIVMAVLGLSITTYRTFLPKWLAAASNDGYDFSSDCKVRRGGVVPGDTPESLMAKGGGFDPVAIPLSKDHIHNLYHSNSVQDAYFYFHCEVSKTHFTEKDETPYIYLGPIVGREGWVYIDGKFHSHFHRTTSTGFFLSDTSKDLFIDIIAIPYPRTMFAGLASTVTPTIFKDYFDYHIFEMDYFAGTDTFARVMCGILFPIWLFFWILYFKGHKYGDILWISISCGFQIFYFAIQGLSEDFPAFNINFVADLSLRMAQISLVVFGIYFLRIYDESKNFLMTFAPFAFLIAFYNSANISLQLLPYAFGQWIFCIMVGLTFISFSWQAAALIRSGLLNKRRRILVTIFAFISLYYALVVIRDVDFNLNIRSKLFFGLLVCDVFFAIITFLEIIHKKIKYDRTKVKFSEGEDDHLALQEQVHLGKTVQKLLLPEIMSGDTEKISFQFLYLPSHSMSGDWIADWSDQAGTRNFILGDVVGKGAQAAIAVTAIMSVFHRAKNTTKPLIDILAEVHHLLGTLFKHHITTTATAVAISPSGEMTLINCAGQGWFVYAAEKSKTLPLRGSLLGSSTDFQAETLTMTLGESEKLFSFTDGIIDGTKTLMKLLRGLKDPQNGIKTNNDLIEFTVKTGEKDVFEDDKAMLVLSSR